MLFLAAVKKIWKKRITLLLSYRKIVNNSMRTVVLTVSKITRHHLLCTSWNTPWDRVEKCPKGQSSSLLLPSTSMIRHKTANHLGEDSHQYRKSPIAWMPQTFSQWEILLLFSVMIVAWSVVLFSYMDYTQSQ